MNLDSRFDLVISLPYHLKPACVALDRAVTKAVRANLPHAREVSVRFLRPDDGATVSVTIKNEGFFARGPFPLGALRRLFGECRARFIRQLARRLDLEFRWAMGSPPNILRVDGSLENRVFAIVYLSCMPLWDWSWTVDDAQGCPVLR